jgi:hypothetical protein
LNCQDKGFDPSETLVGRRENASHRLERWISISKAISATAVDPWQILTGILVYSIIG